jgi:uncharacterized protein (DUF305 family)
VFFSQLRQRRTGRTFQAGSAGPPRAVGVWLHVGQLEDRVNPSHLVDTPAWDWAGAPEGAGRAALVAPASPGPGAASEAAPTRAEARFEVKFMKDMIDHHAMAVMMAELCQEKAVHEELRALCGQIEQTQTEEIAQMQTWLREWYGITYEPEMTPGMERQLEKLAALDGAAFEIAFMEEMIKHHEAAVRGGGQCIERAYHPELVQLCQNIVQTQTEEIQTMQTWLSQWYGIEPRGGNSDGPARR